MFLRCHERKKNGKTHRYWSVMESRRVGGGDSVQRQVLYLGEINDQQEGAWRKTIAVFDEQRQTMLQASLFASDREIEPDQVNALSLVMSEMRLLRPRRFGDCWLGCHLWKELGLAAFWRARLGTQRGAVAWEKVLELLAVNRLCEPGSEFAVHRRWFLHSAMDELLDVDFQVAEKDRLYRCLDRILPFKDELCQHLTERWKTLFQARFDVLLYDLTSTYFEGLCEQIPMAKHGYSRDGRPDCRQVVIALVVTTDGLPLAYEVLPGNTSDKTTLKAFLEKIEKLYGKARRVWVMDRGIPTHDTLQEMREEKVAYLVGTPRSLLSQLEKELLERPWESVHEGMQVKLLEKEGEVYVQARSEARQHKEQAMRRRKLKALVQGLNHLKHRMALGEPATPGKSAVRSESIVRGESTAQSQTAARSESAAREKSAAAHAAASRPAAAAQNKSGVSRDQVLKRVAVLQKEAGRIAKFVQVREPLVNEPVNRKTFVCTLDKAAWKQALERDGSYIIRAYMPVNDEGNQEWPAGLEKQAPVLWQWYMQLVHVEEAFKTLKSDLNLRPIHHQIQPRVEAHVLVAFLGYALMATLRMKLKPAASGLTPQAVLQSLAAIQMVDVEVPTTDGRTLLLRRHTEPETEQRMLLEKLNLQLPAQPPPRIRTAQLPPKKAAAN